VLINAPFVSGGPGLSRKALQRYCFCATWPNEKGHFEPRGGKKGDFRTQNNEKKGKNNEKAQKTTIFCPKCLHISNKSITFAAEFSLKTVAIATKVIVEK